MSLHTGTEVKGIFFDLYGTLLIFNDIDKSWDDWAIAFYELINHKTKMSFDEFAGSCRNFMSRDAKKENSSGLTTYETKIKKHCDSLGIELSTSELKLIADITPRAWQKYISVAPGAIEVLNELKKNKVLVLITNFDHSPHIRKTLAEFNLDSFFSKIIISDEVNITKPDPAIFNIALDQTGLTSDEVIFVGDNPKDDIEGARAAGIEPVLIIYDTFTSKHDYNPGESPIPTSIDNVRIIRSLSELVQLPTA
jgi:putative hydrolase of the HAD superfamily